MVDGKLVTQPVLEALRSNVVDVPLLLSAMQYEADCLPDVDLLALSPEQWKQYLLNKMAPWGRDVAKQIYDLYEPEARASAQKAFGAILSDVALVRQEAAAAVAPSLPCDPPRLPPAARRFVQCLLLVMLIMSAW